MRVRSSKVKDVQKDDSKVEEKMEVNEEGKEDLKEEVKEEMKGECSEDGGWSGVPRCSLETPRRSDWVTKNTATSLTSFTAAPFSGDARKVIEVIVRGHGGVRGRGRSLSPDPGLRPPLVLPGGPALPSNRTLPFRAAVYAESDARRRPCAATPHTSLRLRLLSHSMAIRLLPAIPLGDGVYLVPMETTASVAMTNTDQHQDPQSQEKDLWTIFFPFPRQEQRLLGWLRGRSPQPSCHLKVLQLTKALRDLGGQALDSNRGALWRSVLSSYTLKTAGCVCYSALLQRTGRSAICGQNGGAGPQPEGEPPETGYWINLFLGSDKRLHPA
ncbi:hypothetical protein J4Q44_G00181750 [Coregonus suidteri]|uniref:Uncharacterized protein n=1 Tax=Coregonus suidteri TaxID=861788 RepID=A0AAN8M5Y5_9TELE